MRILSTIISLLLIVGLAACACGAGDAEQEPPNTVNIQGIRLEEKIKAALPRTTITAETLKTSLLCNLQEENAQSVWITKIDKFEEVRQTISHQIIGGKTQEKPKIDFTNTGVLLVSMGQRPTTGYNISLADETVPINDDMAEIKILWTEPEPGSFLAQTVTEPCLLISLPIAEYSHIRIIDQDDTIRATVEVK